MKALLRFDIFVDNSGFGNMPKALRLEKKFSYFANRAMDSFYNNLLSLVFFLFIGL